MFDGLILLIERPVLTLLTAVVVVGVFLIHGCVYEGNPPVTVQEIQYSSPSEVQTEEDRRIVRFAKWLSGLGRDALWLKCCELKLAGAKG